MLVENKLVDRKNVFEMMIREFGGDTASRGSLGPLEFIPLGEDSWSYRCGEYWVSVRRDLGGHFPAAYESARLLRESGKEFILAPLRGKGGRVVHRVDGFPVVVFPYLERAARGDIGCPTTSQLEVMVRKLDELHRCVLPVELPVEDFRLPFEEDLEKALRTAVSGDSDVGRMSRDLHRLIIARWDHIAEQRRQIAEMAAACSEIWRDRSPRAITHGDPGRANVLLDGDVLILDWGGLMWSPPERDWSAISRSFGIALRGRAEMLRFYQLRWTLSEIAEYTTRFVELHTGDADDQAMWQRLVEHVNCR